MNLRKLFITTLLSVTVLTAGNSEVNKTALFLENNKMLAETMGVEELLQEDYYVEYDEADVLFNKFNFSYAYRDYFRQLCLLQNVNPIEAIALMNIESWCGNHRDYNNRTEERAYYTKGEKCWDDGLFQLTSYSKYRQEQQDRFYNPELIFSLGYVRNEDVFDANDDISNMQVGIAYFGFLYRYYGDYYTASLAFNCGLGNVNNGNVPEVTYEYAHAIKNRWSRREGDI